MSLFFGGTSTPPISPHVAPRSALHFPFQSSGPSSSGPLQRMAGGGLRPTRRDLLLCIITLSLSYLIFNRGGPSQTTTSLSRSDIGAQHPASGFSEHLDVPGGSGFRSPLGSFSSVPAQVKCPPGVQVLKYETFTEAAESRGFDGVAIAKAAGQANVAPVDWDDIEDERVQDMLTVKVAHQPGWTLAEKFYLYNGSIYVVTTSRGDWPELTHMISTGLPANGDPGNMEARRPKGHEMIFITPREAANLWGSRVYKMSGMTYLWNDGQFIDHYYHYAAELLLGTWRVHASLDPSIGPDGRTSIPGPQRAWFIHQGIDEWRDKPKFNPMITTALFPNMALLYPQDWAALKNQTISQQPKAYMLEQAILADRSASFYGEMTGPNSRTVASAVYVGTVSRWWWEPVRRQMLRYSGVSEDVIDRSREGYGQVDILNLRHKYGYHQGYGLPSGMHEPELEPGEYTPVVTYISRQNSRRRLTPESHADLVQHLEALQKKIAFELHIVEAERMTKEEQIALAGKTTIMLGVHGNGLTHLLWMPATARSAVIEMFIDGGFARDYQWTAHALGMKHFAVQHDKWYTAPDIAKTDYPEGFQGAGITVDGKTVADIIEKRLAMQI